LSWQVPVVGTGRGPAVIFNDPGAEVGPGLTVAGVHDAGLSSFQWPSETTSMLLSVTLMAV
jgi:hypothetical protein